MIERGISVELKNFKYGINTQGCPLNSPPKEIIENNKLEKFKGTVELYEAKLTIIGEGGTGKTTLFEKLKNHQSFGAR